MAGLRDALPESSRYELLVKIASGGMATVYVGRLRASASGRIARLFAIKRAHPHLVEPVFRSMFVGEARLASRIHHPNVVAVQDVEESDDELILAMDYVEGTSLSELWRLAPDLDERVRVRVAIRVVLDACAGLQAAHELKGDDGASLEIVHRDVSPHNLLVGLDGIARLTDFGIAKSAAHTGGATATGGLKGKLGYMAPEYVDGGQADRRADVFALGIVLWEGITGARLFSGGSEVERMRAVLRCEVAAPSTRAAGLSPELDGVVLRALARAPADRFPTALAFADALETAARRADSIASSREVGAVVENAVGDSLAARRRTLTKDGDVGDAVAESPSLEYAGHERTATLEPLQATPIGTKSEAPRPTSATPPALVSPPRDRSPNRRALVLVGALAAATAGIVVVSRAISPARETTTPSTRGPVDGAASASASRADDSVPALPVPDPAVPSASSPTPPSASVRRAPGRTPSRRDPPSPRPAPPAASSVTTPEPEPGPPTHAPPNPYRPAGTR